MKDASSRVSLLGFQQDQVLPFQIVYHAHVEERSATRPWETRVTVALLLGPYLAVVTGQVVLGTIHWSVAVPGALLILLAIGIWRRTEVGWWLTVCVAAALVPLMVYDMMGLEYPGARPLDLRLGFFVIGIAGAILSLLACCRLRGAYKRDRENK